MRFLACAIQGDLRRKLITSCATVFPKLRASSANLKSGKGPLPISSECRIAVEILSLGVEVPTDDVCLAEVGTTLSVFDVEASCHGHVLEVLSDCFGPGFVREALRQATAIPDNLFEPAAEHMCGDCKSRMIWRCSIPNVLKPLEDHVVYSRTSNARKGA
ncbi:unnamed protein product [Polarella glacialis]|uniref:Uncharacterized protein n=1 Tax=Polarella glacialis TaxID=89957 RepID=A0A813GJS7_POLGL|nr:unnamed protein product [Polarella glacialis]CAE8626424.1 unnamed protein product [Polarella glacialis]